ncbi:hypothetical protein ABZ671_00825 [Micromonospora sp. NPDC006766]|uniref:hypothetical protein n=1 Tax=Micromonospora sp. NPDC006766 TaxID=3154778 RepID=UPI0033EDECF0
MARLTGPDESCRTVYLRDGRARAAGFKATLYVDVDCMIPADDILDLDGQPIPGAVVEVDEYSRLPLVLYPDGVKALYTTVADGPVVVLHAASNERLAGLEELAGSMPDPTTVMTGDRNLAELADRASARLNLGLSEAATRDIGAGAGTIAAGDDSRIVGAAQRELNLSDVASPTLARANLGLGNVDNTSDAAKPVSAATQAALNGKAPLNNPAFTGTVTGVTKAHVGLGAVDNTADMDKPVSTATQAALNGKAPLNNPTFTGTVSGVTKAHVGLGNVDNTSDAAKPVSTAQATALAAKLTRGETWVSVTDYGAVGDAQYLDQRGTGAWGLASFVPQDPATYGRCFTNSVFTVPATDNTAAFRSAWDALMASGKFSFTRRDILTGYRGSRLRLHIPAGAYYISDAAALFSLERAAPSGTPVGFDITGDGNFNTILYVRITGNGPTDYLFYDNNWGNGVKLYGLTIVGVTGNERFIYHTSSGNSKRWKIDSCTFKDYKQFLQIAGGLNADRWTLTSCTWSTAVAGANLLTNLTNPQAVGFDFHSPSIVHSNGGNVFDMGAGGHLRIFGGTTDLWGKSANGAAGRFAYIHGDGSTLGYQTIPAITVNNHKFELHEDAGLVDINWNQIIFRDSSASLHASTRWANGLKHHIAARGRGQVWWEGGMFSDMYVGLSVAGDWPISTKAAVTIRNAILEIPDLIATRVGYYLGSDGDGLTTDFLTTVGTGSGVGIGRMIVEGCIPYGASYSGNPSTHIAVNGSPYAARSWYARPAQIQRLMHRYGSAIQFGLPAEGQTAVVQIPPGCHLVRVGIVKQGTQSGIGSNSRTWKVSDGNGTALATLTAVGTAYHVQATSPEINRTVVTDNDRTFTLSCDPAIPSSVGTGAEGYFWVDYI